MITVSIADPETRLPCGTARRMDSEEAVFNLIVILGQRPRVEVVEITEERIVVIWRSPTGTRDWTYIFEGPSDEMYVFRHITEWYGQATMEVTSPLFYRFVHKRGVREGVPLLPVSSN